MDYHLFTPTWKGFPFSDGMLDWEEVIYYLVGNKDNQELFLEQYTILFDTLEMQLHSRAEFKDIVKLATKFNEACALALWKLYYFEQTGDNPPTLDEIPPPLQVIPGFFNEPTLWQKVKAFAYHSVHNFLRNFS